MDLKKTEIPSPLRPFPILKLAAFPLIRITSPMQFSMSILSRIFQVWIENLKSSELYFLLPFSNGSFHPPRFLVPFHTFCETFKTKPFINFYAFRSVSRTAESCDRRTHPQGRYQVCDSRCSGRHCYRVAVRVALPASP